MHSMNKPDNISLYSDMRQFLAYIQANHGNTYRYKIQKVNLLEIVCVISGKLLYQDFFCQYLQQRLIRLRECPLIGG